VLLSSSLQQILASNSSGRGPNRCGEGCCLLRALAISWLDATARNYKTINCEQFSQGKSSILAAYKVLMKERTWC
jgi:hypothetical protein